MKQPIFLSPTKLPQNSHKFFGSYIPPICQNPFLPSSKIIQEYSFPILSSRALCEGSAIYIFLIALKIFGHSFLPKSLPHDKIQLHFPSKSYSANFQSFCPERSFVKEVLARLIQMSWNFGRPFIWSNNCFPPNFISIQQSMWAHLQILVSGHNFSLWSNYILYCFKNSEINLGLKYP